MPNLQAVGDAVAFTWVKDPAPSTIEGFVVDSERYESSTTRMGNVYTCMAVSGDGLSQGQLFLLHEYDKIDQGGGWEEDKVMYCRKDKILCLLDKPLEVTERERELTEDEERRIVDEL